MCVGWSSYWPTGQDAELITLEFMLKSAIQKKIHNAQEIECSWKKHYNIYVYIYIYYRDTHHGNNDVFFASAPQKCIG